MKKLFLSTIASILFFSFNCFSQTVNNIPLAEIDVEYIEIIGTSKMMSQKVTVDIDFGQENKYWTAKDTELKDAEGKLIVFNSMIDALNFFAKNNYEFVNAYAVSLGSSVNVYHYLLRKKLKI